MRKADEIVYKAITVLYDTRVPFLSINKYKPYHLLPCLDDDRDQRNFINAVPSSNAVLYSEQEPNFRPCNDQLMHHASPITATYLNAAKNAEDVYYIPHYWSTANTDMSIEEILGTYMVKLLRFFGPHTHEEKSLAVKRKLVNEISKMHICNRAKWSEVPDHYIEVGGRLI